MIFIKINNFNLGLLLYIGKLWLLLLMSISVKMTAQMYVSDKTVFTVKGNTIIFNRENISEDVSQSNSKETQIAKVYITEGTLITNFPSDSLQEIVYLEKEKPSEKPIKEIAKREKKEKNKHESSAKTTDDVKEKEILIVLKSKQNNSSVIFSSGNRLNAISVPSVSFTVKSISAKSKQEKRYHALLFDLENTNIINSFEDLRRPQHLLQSHITRPPPFLDFDSPLRFLI